ncbi:hypothetical protein [Vibrio furnissii]|uniref:hypothetical protein n=1 Tax=Vibrio furnissii TaxID=29494 RepID=UPI001EEBB345|nr:hypothetical protein [Vibrio furnissii]MCG6216229.1 hypothetical protein [Vibrio furnissii]
MGWIYLPSVSIQNGSNIVTVNNTATDSIKPGDGLLIGSYDLVEIIEVSIGQLKLKKNWSSANQSNAEAAVVPTFGDFNAATAALRQATTITQGNFAEMEKWWTQLGQVTFKAYNNTVHTVRTAKQMEQDVSALEVQANALIAEIAGAGYARSESDMMADRERNNNLFAASGAIHHGKHWHNAPSEVPVNEGMNSLTTTPNSFRMGRRASDGMGGSKTPFAIYNLAGITAHLQGLSASPIADTGQIYGMALKLPTAPKGTEVYDSATGILTNFETDIDPKYGDVAADTNEAVARAFEKHVAIPKTDFESNCYDTSVTRTAIQWATDSPAAAAARLATYNIKAGVSYILEFDVSSTNALTSIGFLGVGNWYSLFQHMVAIPAGLDKTTRVTVSLPAPTVDLAAGTKMGILYNTTGVRKISNVSLSAVTEEVVTCPVDLIGLEFFLRPINEADPFAYPYGMQQSKLTSVDGIATVENNVRPITHFEVYPGDTTSRGRGWNLLDASLTDAQKAKIFQNTAHNIYRMNDGTIVQWTASQRTIRGAGNGDFLSMFTGGNFLDTLLFSSTKQVGVRGNNNSAPDYFNNSAGVWYSSKHPSGINDQIGVFKAGRANAVVLSAGVNGECYFYVIATVPRLNQGVYHPNLNPMGTKMCNTVGTSSTGSYWYDSNSLVPLTTSECFRQIDATIDSTTRGAALSTGAISSSYSGHPNNLRFDAIYASGQGGVIDHRLKYGAWDASSAEQAAVVREEVKNGTYHGRENLVFTHVQTGTQSSSAASTNAFTVDDVSKFVVGDLVSIVSGGVIVAKDRVVTSIGSSNITFNGDGVPRDVKSYYFVVTTKTKLTVEGEFTQTDVIGDPANILQVDALKDGWLGSWVPVIPDGSSKEFPLTRKDVSGNPEGVQTIDGGSTWTVNSFATFDQVKNSCQANWELGRVLICNYRASAKQTAISSNLPVFNGERGLSSVFSSANYRVANGCLLSESLFGNVLKSNSNLPRDKSYPLSGFSISSSGALEPSGNMTSHSQIDLLAPTSGDKAFKVLYCQSSSDKQANLNIIANELIYSSTASNWGDDSKVKVLADSTFTDLNGNKCKAVIHKLAKPYGFIQNKI